MNLDADSLLKDLVDGLEKRLNRLSIDEPILIGVHTGGVWIAQHLHDALDVKTPLGQLNIAFYRDDFSRIGLHPSVEPSHLPFDINDRHLILIDDILYTGRTIRAAMNEIFDYGRPASISLVVLIDRSGRELPVQADVTGTTLNLATTEHVKLHGPDKLRLELCQAKTP